MLNPRLDLAALHAEFARDGRIRIRDVLDPAVANAIADEMASLPWKVFCATGAGVAVIDPAEMAGWDRARQTELQRSLLQAASRAEGFAYFGSAPRLRPTPSARPIEVAADRYWGAQAQRSLGNFKIGWEKQPAARSSAPWASSSAPRPKRTWSWASSIPSSARHIARPRRK
jgi:hypothetical protein